MKLLKLYQAANIIACWLKYHLRDDPQNGHTYNNNSNEFATEWFMRMGPFCGQKEYNLIKQTTRK